LACAASRFAPRLPPFAVLAAAPLAKVDAEDAIELIVASLRQSLFVPLLDVNEGTRAMGVSETDARVRTCDPLNQSPA
jgi:hypothetical protein